MDQAQRLSSEPLGLCARKLDQVRGRTFHPITQHMVWFPPKGLLSTRVGVILLWAPVEYDGI